MLFTYYIRRIHIFITLDIHSNVKKRVDEHNESDKNTFTSKHRPWVLKGYFGVNGTEANAIGIEKFIKKQKSSKFIERLLEEETVFSDVLAQLVRVPKLRD
ncbi:hypothetical protein Q73A0000_13245 [Kaistella flava (ex Peng et al. 2021)]|uniref:GIY-YIG domain-containing protein n=1 Tax=Kaistella flava (ex Peng et al. 2021) TaxID=2038776 RepID=A0A7M2YC76_9FLAO|nr:hypothetical protein Q73A0000_13245 [Kaistella flava (ex Peng et al. 2021)]